MYHTNAKMLLPMLEEIIIENSDAVKFLDGGSRYILCVCSRARTASSLRTELRILRDDKKRPLFQDAIVTNLVVTQGTK